MFTWTLWLATKYIYKLTCFVYSTKSYYTLTWEFHEFEFNKSKIILRLQHFYNKLKVYEANHLEFLCVLHKSFFLSNNFKSLFITSTHLSHIILIPLIKLMMRFTIYIKGENIIVLRSTLKFSNNFILLSINFCLQFYLKWIGAKISFCCVVFPFNLFSTLNYISCYTYHHKL